MNVRGSSQLRSGALAAALLFSLAAAGAAAGCGAGSAVRPLVAVAYA